MGARHNKQSASISSNVLTHEGWENFAGESRSLISASSANATGSNSERGQKDSLNCLLHYSTSEALSDPQTDYHTDLQELSLPWDDDLVDLLATATSDSHSADFNMLSPSSNSHTSPSSQKQNQQNGLLQLGPDCANLYDFDMVRISIIEQ